MEVREILIINTYTGFGEMLMASPMLEETRNNFPKANIQVLVGSTWSKEILENNPGIAQTYVMSKEALMILRSRKYDIVFCLNTGLRNIINAWKFKHKILSGIDVNYSGFLFNYKFRRFRGDKVHERDSYLGVLNAMGIFTTEKNMRIFLSQEEVSSFVKLWGIDQKKTNRIAIFPSVSENVAGGILALRGWDISKYTTLIKSLLARGFEVFLIGSQNDKPIVQKISDYFQGSSLVVNMCGKLKLRETAILLSYCEVLVTNDSGPMHLAAAVGTRTVTIFGPTDPDTRIPYGEKHSAVFAESMCQPWPSWRGGNCRPCHLSHFPSTITDCKTRECMVRIDVSEVLSRI